MSSMSARPDDTKLPPDATYDVTAACPVCGRQHITVFKLRHYSDSLFSNLGNFYRYAKHLDSSGNFWCSNSEQSPNWAPVRTAGTR